MNNTLANGLTLLELLSATAESFSVTELAQRLDAPKSHAHRLLQTLVERGYAVQDPDRRYRIGLQPLVVSSALLANHPLRGVGRPWLHRVSKELGLDAILAIPHDHGCGLVIASVYPEGRQLDPASAIGSRMRPGGTATATLFDALIDGFNPDSPLTATRRRQIRRDGYAVKDPKHEGAGNGLALAIRDADEQIIAAVGCSGPSDHFQAHLPAAIDLLTQAATAIGQAIPSLAAH